MTTTPSTSLSPVGVIGRIPVRNIWLLMLYASDLYHELPQERRVAVEDAPDDLPNLVAELLSHAVERRLRRNLTFGYRRRRADLSRVRGRIDLFRTERRQLLKRGKSSVLVRRVDRRYAPQPVRQGCARLARWNRQRLRPRPSLPSRVGQNGARRCYRGAFAGTTPTSNVYLSSWPTRRR